MGEAGGRADAQIEPLLIRQRQQVLQHAAHHRQDGHDGGDGSCGGRGLPLSPARVLCPRQQQKLLQQMPTAPDARLQCLQTLGGLRGHRGCMQPFGLQRQGGQRRAQLVRRVGNEATLAFHGRTGAAQQSVDGVHEGLKLGGQIGFRQRLQVMLLTGIDGAGQLRQWPQHQSDQHQHHRQQHGHQQQQRQRGVEGALPCNLISDAGFLRDGNATAVAQAMHIDAVVQVLMPEGVKAVLQRGRQRQTAGLVVVIIVILVTRSGRTFRVRCTCRIRWSDRCCCSIIRRRIFCTSISGRRLFPVCSVLTALRQGRQALDDQSFLVVVGLQAALHRQ